MTDLALGAARTTAEPKPLSYARLAKLDVYDYYLALLVVLSATLLPLAGFDTRIPGTLALFGLGSVCMVAAMVAFDDLAGYRDGSDTVNYVANPTRRRARRKPLVSGALTEREVVVFAWVTATAGAVLMATTTVLAPHAPLWTIVVLALTYVLSLQYSCGLRISYHGLQEAFIAGLGWAMVLVPYGLATGLLHPFVIVQAFLFGLGPLLFVVYANTNDVPGDRAVGRPTVAVLSSERGNAWFVVELTAIEFMVTAAASWIGIAPAWFVLVMLPVTVLRVRQLGVGFGPRRDILLARSIGFTTHRLSVTLMVVANIVHAATA